MHGHDILALAQFLHSKHICVVFYVKNVIHWISQLEVDNTT
jgi:hypothetical protein